MPYPNEHAARLRNPDKYDKIRRENDKFGSGIDAIWGVLPDGKVELQAIRFDKNKFTVAEAKKWLADHDHKPILFEPASEGKSMTTELLRKSFYDVEFVSKSINEDERTIDCVFTSRKQDLEGDIVETEGLDFSQYGGSVLWNHNFNQPAVMKCVDGSIKLTKTKGSCTVQFDNETQFGRDLWSLAKNGYIKSWSMTFKMLDGERLPQKSGISNAFLQHQGYHVTKALVVEISLCNVGINSDAKSKALNLITDDVLREDFMEKAYAHTSKVDDYEPKWSDVNKDKLPPEAFAEVGDDEKPSTWKFPHHWISDSIMYVHKGGLKAAWAAAQGARSGQEASNAVKSHLQKHRKALGIDSKSFNITIDAKGEITSHCDKPVLSTALDKSFRERGESGNIPLVLTYSEKACMTLDCEVIKESDSEITEVKVASVAIALPVLPQNIGTPESRQMLDGEPKSTDLHSLDLDLAKVKSWFVENKG